MEQYFNVIPMTIFAIGWAGLLLQIGRANIIWARRCDPKNPAFKKPKLGQGVGSLLLALFAKNQGD